MDCRLPWVGVVSKKWMVFFVFLYKWSFPALLCSAGSINIITHTATPDASKCLILHLPTLGLFLGRDDPGEKGMATQSSILA